MNLRLGHDLSTLRPTLHNGPGWRIGLWTQGCVHRCTTQCLNPHLLDPTRGKLWPVEQVVLSVREAAAHAIEPVEGVTVLGGEPFEQADAVGAVLTQLRAAGLSTMVYSGHTLESLQKMNDSGVDTLLAVTDILVDGPYLPDFSSDTIAWRGSSNQRLVCLSMRYTPEQLDAAFARQRKGFSIQVLGGRISVSGIQDAGAASHLEQLLGLPVGEV